MNTYYVYCENIGMVHEGHNYQKALKDFKHYSELAEMDHGKASGEIITLFKNNELIDEYVPNNRIKLYS